jgi:hypothetical protein
MLVTMAFAVVGHLAAERAIATTFVLMNEEDLARRADAALIGSVVSVEAVMDGGTIHTYVSLAPDAILFGDLAATEEIVLQELGGSVANRRQRVFGTPSYAVGERVLVFVNRTVAGTLHTTAMAMGKYRLAAGFAGSVLASRTLDDGSAVLDPQAGALMTSFAHVELFDLLARIERVRAIRLPVGFDPAVETPGTSGAFTYLGDPSRWFEPDEGDPVAFLVYPEVPGQPDSAEMRRVVREALAAWSNDPLSALTLTDGSLDEPMPFQTCSGPNRIVFDDPFDEVDDPFDCVGVVALGGYCALAHEARSIEGQMFRRIRVGRVTFGNGWDDCPFWNECTIAEVAAHEIGHAIGLGHSSDKEATMSPVAALDGRCAQLQDDDLAGLRSLYPRNAMELSPTPTRTPSTRATPTARMTSTATRTSTTRPTRTPRRDPGDPPRPDDIPTPTRAVETPTPGVTRTPLPTSTSEEAGVCQGDANDDGEVTIDEVVAVLSNSLRGCTLHD